MKRFLIIFCIFLIPFFAFSQESQNRNILLTSSNIQIGGGFATLNDPYLSPEKYSGWQMRLSNKRERFFNKKTTRFILFTRFLAYGGMAFHPAKSSIMLYGEGNAMFGGQYRFIPLKNLHCSTGFGWDIGMGSKYLPRNVNNPANIDLYSGLNAVADIRYDFRLWNIPFRLNYGLESPLTGCMFVPQGGATYYEVFSLKNTKDIFHFSSLHNRQNINHYFQFGVKLKAFSIKLGANQDFRLYKANNMVFKQNNITFCIGTVFHIYRYFGRRSEINNIFISPNDFNDIL